MSEPQLKTSTRLRPLKDFTKRALLALRFDRLLVSGLSGFLVLCYHSVPRKGDWYYDTPVLDFRNQIRYITDNFQIIPSENLLTQPGRTEDNIRVVLTFDDGYHDNYFNVFSILKEYEVPMTFFITPGIMEESTNKVTEATKGVRKEILSWEQVREMSKNPLVTFGSHGLFHSAMTSLGTGEALKEMTDSKRIIEGVTGREVHLFAYPGGFFNQETGGLLRSSGYLGAFTSEANLNPWHASRYEMGRVAITSRSRDVPSFAYRISSIFRRARQEGS